MIADRRAQIVESMRQAALGIEQFNDFLVIENYFSIAIQPCVPIAHGYEAYWVFQPDQRVEVDLTIGVPLSCPGDLNVLGYFFFPRMLFQNKVRIQSNSTDRANLHACNLLELINELKR